MDNQVKNEIIEKFEKNLDDSLVIVKIGDLKEIIPHLNKILNKPKLIPEKPKKIVGDNEIITLSELEQRLITAALEKTSGDIEMTCNELGISERTLRRKFEEYKINYKNYAKKSKNNK